MIPAFVVVATHLALVCPLADTAGPPAAFVFTDVTREAGIDFVHTLGDDRMTNIVEATGVGCGFVDVDNDGWLDIYLMSGCWQAGVSDADLPAEQRSRLARATDRLYRNRGNGTFEDITHRAGIDRPGYGMAILAADFDNDGDQDLYITGYGPNFYYRNAGAGRFEECAAAVGLADDQFGVGAAALDYNRDGRPDLYLGNYLTYDAERTPEFARDRVRSPLAYEGQPDRLFAGNSDGTFRDVTAATGITAKPAGRAMGVGAFDYDRDGRWDVFVSNDAMENHLWHGQPGGRFTNTALLAGVAFSAGGAGAAAMAAEFGDYNHDGWLDLLVPDMNTGCLYQNVGGGMFDDVAVPAGLSAPLMRVHSWGAVLADFDLDGHLDAFITNGHAATLDAQPNTFYHGDGRGRFSPVTAALPGCTADSARVSRGCARGDFDNDGDLDLLVANLNAAPRLLRNDTPRLGRHFLTVKLLGTVSGRDALGTVVRVRCGNTWHTAARLAGGSYLSQHDNRLHFGLGKTECVGDVIVRWPDGAEATISGELADTILEITQPTPAPSPPHD